MDSTNKISFHGEFTPNLDDYSISDLDNLIKKLKICRDLKMREMREEDHETKLYLTVEALDAEISNDVKKSVSTVSQSETNKMIKRMKKRSKRFGTPLNVPTESICYTLESFSRGLETKHLKLCQELANCEIREGDSIPKTEQEIKDANDEFEAYIKIRDQRMEHYRK